MSDLHKIELLVDDDDYRDINRAVSGRQLLRIMPDSDHDDANMIGRLIGEICRGYMEMINADEESEGL